MGKFDFDIDLYNFWKPKNTSSLKKKDENEVNTKHIVKQGEYLSKIARDYNLSLDDIKKYNPDIKDINKISVGQEINVKQIKDKEDNIQEKKEPKQYVVKRGDYAGKIAKQYNLSLDEFKSLNPHIKDINRLYIGDKINIEKKKEQEAKIPFYLDRRNAPINIKYQQMEEDEINNSGDNLRVIQSKRHDSNYVVIDKKNGTLNIYDKNNKLIKSVNQIKTGDSRDDYNTITYVESNKRNKDGGKAIKDKVGNMSTPAGITIITSTQPYYGHASFSRGRVDSNGNVENIASSIHMGRDFAKGSMGSNGCVRVDGKTLDEISKYIGKGTYVYTLPEKEGSRFTIKNGKLNYVADNPYTSKYSNDDKKHKNWDDYNVTIDKSYSGLKIDRKNIPYNDKDFLKSFVFRNIVSRPFLKSFALKALLPGPLKNIGFLTSFVSEKLASDPSESINPGSKDYIDNSNKFKDAIVSNKKDLQKRFGLTSDEYNKLAMLAMGIGEQESKFGTSVKYVAKEQNEPLVNFLKQVRKNKSSNSKGYSQIKIDSDNDGMKKIYEELGIDRNNLSNADKSAIATIARLAYIYNTEVRGRKFYDKNNNKIDDYDALLYKWNGRNSELMKKPANPKSDDYIKKVRKYSDNFSYWVDPYDVDLNI